MQFGVTGAEDGGEVRLRQHRQEERDLAHAPVVVLQPAADRRLNGRVVEQLALEHAHERPRPEVAVLRPEGREARGRRVAVHRFERLQRRLPHVPRRLVVGLRERFERLDRFHPDIDLPGLEGEVDRAEVLRGAVVQRLEREEPHRLVVVPDRAFEDLHDARAVALAEQFGDALADLVVRVAVQLLAENVDRRGVLPLREHLDRPLAAAGVVPVGELGAHPLGRPGHLRGQNVVVRELAVLVELQQPDAVVVAHRRDVRLVVHGHDRQRDRPADDVLERARLHRARARPVLERRVAAAGDEPVAGHEHE